MPGRRTMPANLVLAVCIAKTLHERDAGFLRALQENVDEFLNTEPKESASADVLGKFAAHLREPITFVRK